MGHWADNYELTIRTRNVLKFYVSSLEDLLAMNDAEILCLPNVGRKTWTEIKYVFFGCEPRSNNKLPKSCVARLRAPRPLKPSGRSVYLITDEMNKIIYYLPSGPLKEKISQALIDADAEYAARVRSRIGLDA